jgi:hypothetical protein
MSWVFDADGPIWEDDPFDEFWDDEIEIRGARELVHSGEFNFGDCRRTCGTDWDRLIAHKAAQCTPAFRDSIARDWVNDPIAWEYAGPDDNIPGLVLPSRLRVIRDGHHRLALAYTFNQLVPIVQRHRHSPYSGRPNWYTTQAELDECESASAADYGYIPV